MKVISNDIKNNFIFIIEMLLEHRENLSDDKDIEAINMSVILNSAIFLESFIDNFSAHLLEDYFNYGFFPLKNSLSFFDRVQKGLFDKITQLIGLKKIEQIIYLFSGQKLSEIKRLDLEAINKLFMFRNLIAHGKPIVKDYNLLFDEENNILEETNINLTSQYNDLLSFLYKKELIETKEKELSMSKKFFSNNVADYFQKLSFDTEIIVQYFLFNIIRMLESNREKYFSKKTTGKKNDKLIIVPF